jgi:hypothetical protein
VGNPYPFELADASSGVVKIAGKATFTDPANQPGGGSQPVQSGAGSPVGTVAPTAKGYVYIDTANGAVFVAIGATNADWLKLGGVTASTGDAPGVSRDATGSQFMLGGDPNTPFAHNAVLSDAYAQWNGNGDGLAWSGNGTDGEQALRLRTGSKETILGDLNATMTLGAGGVIFPAADPHIVGAWWDNAGTLTRSAG